ncbi:MAG: Predicted transcriptional regulator LiuR of leucine degradation pathway, MerR family [uncultured Thiotrichaceae bacterium]|uniref:Predicted transcriptional regulator LiuR of leucine degradation pathway, MerR family n=1 Tax=uncultured Thiotrichaceae bacterium TaxID=298394 RepID=A0A6S6TCJ8_9GAMM|nr:MAG: Predicted transcriptional regulator LiuR of leucine degradation pathway, MerR family [uncultured Thiotrichaceae bacterium]
MKLWTISELCSELGITTRTIRFYEDKGLLTPERLGANRIYSYKDKARMQLILRGKRLGFALDEIKEYIDLYDADLGPMQREQINFLLERVKERRVALIKQQNDLQEMLRELTLIEDECQGMLNVRPTVKG